MTDTATNYETILKHIRDGVYTLDASGQITWVNRTAVKEFEIGYTREELIGAPVSKVLTDEDLEKCLSIIRTLLRDDNRESGRCEIVLQTATDEAIPCDLHLTLLPPEDGEFQGTVGVVREITEQKHREQRLEVLNRILRHNLSNAMTVILGRVEHLEDRVDHEYQPAVDAIRERGEELLEISNKVQQIQQIESDIVTQQPSLDLIGPVEDILAQFYETYPGVEFDVDVPAEANAVVGQRELFSTALTNLIENAIEHNDADQPRVSVSIQKDCECILIHVEDNGPGLPPIEQKVLTTGTESPLEHSMGIGLWLASWSVRAFDGDIRFEEGTPRGTIITMELPRAGLE